jgi:hypothetical protein
MDSRKARCASLGAPYTSVPFSPALEQLFIVSAKQIADAARATMGASAPVPVGIN